MICIHGDLFVRETKDSESPCFQVCSSVLIADLLLRQVMVFAIHFNYKFNGWS